MEQVLCAQMRSVTAPHDDTCEDMMSCTDSSGSEDAHSTHAQRHSATSELQATAMAGMVQRRYSMKSHRWDEGNLYRARKRMRVAHMAWNYGTR